MLQSFIRFPLTFLVSLCCTYLHIGQQNNLLRSPVLQNWGKGMLQDIEIPSQTCSLIPFLAQRPLESVDRAQSHFQRHCSFKSDHDIARKLREFNIPPAPMTMQEITDNQLEPLHIFLLVIK